MANCMYNVRVYSTNHSHQYRAQMLMTIIITTSHHPIAFFMLLVTDDG